MESKNNIDKPISALQQILLGSYNDATLFQAFQLLNKILSNIVQNPSEQKYRKINKEAKAIKEKLLAVKEAEGLLKSLGFREQDGHLIFESDEVQNLKAFAEMVQVQETIIAERNMTPEERADREKKKFLEERQRKIDEEFRRKEEEQRRLKELSELDKKEQALRAKPKDSVACTTKFGSDVKRFKDIGVDLNAKRG